MKKTSPPLPARFRDKHVLYEASVQEVDADLDFVARMFRRERGRPLRMFREDFCGTARICATWVQRHPEHLAIGVDNHLPTLNWARKNHLAPLGEAGRRVTLIHGDVREINRPRAEAIGAFNFSYSLFKTREALREYFKHVRRSLTPDGLFVMDAFGGIRCVQYNKDIRSVPDAVTADGEKIPTFIYEWEHRHFDVIHNHLVCDIHFELGDGTRIDRAFTYDWRLWSLPELREILAEAGFASSNVYIHGWLPDGSADGVYRLRKRYDNEDGWIAYVVAIP
ncbi:MAG TPA: class I SAM-dependent methyltransferase [Kiritimatiellia bacterium]|nr:class I SAM-dependent methyltransferase [Kiritimatiellia bacterium]